MPRLLAFRPATVVHRLRPRSAACPLSLGELLRPVSALGRALPLVRAPLAAVARGALVAAREAESAIGLALPPGVPPEGWFDAVAGAADDVAAGLPIFLCGEVRVDGEGEASLARAAAEAFRLVDAGLTHLAVELSSVPAAARARCLAAVIGPALERGIAVDCILAAEGEVPAPARAAGALAPLLELGARPDAASVRCAAPADAAAAHEQVRRLAALAAVLDLPMVRRGPVTADVLEAIAAAAGAPGPAVRVCEDGGAAASAAMALLPWELLEAPGAGERADDGARVSPLERAAAALPAEAAERLEARAYVETAELIERLGASGSAPELAQALERQPGGGR